ncbi:M3 family metallopeptidase [Carboxylicivirga sp. A043]|uniref:M3 family metallopeptidase n=1 Tax=Carboxylicivirga litoralis TaxID=2816963 RepID=UPI0021CB2279|nr:M3 family metallopeptidase [Carboxylicivirga sp. A043]MCU4155718.1 M3 family metallopeptidase [Carboxylicivirga sp. A043]
MNKLFSFLLALVVLASACQTATKTTEGMNPFFTEYETPFQTPPFDIIKVEHYMPAFEKGMKEQVEEIDAIVNNREQPSFENTILAYDRSGALLDKISSVFFNIQGTDNNDDIQKIARTITPLLTKHSDNISMNMGLFNKVKAVYEQREEMNLTAAQKRVTEKYYNDFVRNGAELSAEDQAKLKQFNEQLSTLQLEFSENQLNETNKNFKLVIDKEADLAGLPEGVISAAAETAKANDMEGKWVFTLQKPSLIPFLQYADNRDLREEIYRGYFMRGNNNNEFDNKEIARKVAMLRSERVKLLGYETHADYAIATNMAQTPENVDEFLMGLWKPALKVAKQELKEMQQIIDQEGGKFELQSWDWWYYAEKLRKAKYDLDESEITPYFQLENVRDGMFWVANQLYGITFTPIENIQVYNPAAEVFEVKEANGEHVGLLYLDYHPRDSKRPGAWQTSFRQAITKDGKKITPLVSLVCNFTAPTGDIPALLTFDEVSTLFHEFGHGLHALFTSGEFKRTAGVVPQDYVELPSQIMENWAAEPQVMRHYARHYKTGEVIPDHLIEKIQKSGHFNQGFATVEYLAASLLDLKWHALKAGDVVENTVEFEKTAMDEIGLIEEIIPRYRSTYFGHIFSSDYYAAGYYVYIWAAVLDSDAFDAFKQSGDIFNKELAVKFRQHCLSECGDDEGMIQYRKFRGQEPSLQPLLNKRGLN